MAKHTGIFIALAIALGISCGLADLSWANQIADTIAWAFINLLKWLSIPIIFFSILASMANIQNHQQLLGLGRRVLKYTLATTLIAASIALGLFLLLQPAATPISNLPYAMPKCGTLAKCFSFILVATVLCTLALCFVIVTRAEQTRLKWQTRIQNYHSQLMRLVNTLLLGMPIAIWAFVCLFFQEFDGLTVKRIGLYLLCIVSANLVQAIIVLPIFLRSKGIPIWQTFKHMFPALNVAFWAKSSNVALPVAIRCAKDSAGVQSHVAQFSLPLCTTINMNACAAFILTTVLFVSMSHGVTFSLTEMLVWIFIATFAAVGNAGVPMGCFTLASALLTFLGVPLYLMGIILPFYALIDMLETAINVWSDSCITIIVDKEELEAVNTAIA